MTLVEKLKQLLGNDIDIEVDDDAKIEDLIKTEMVKREGSDEVKTEPNGEEKTDTKGEEAKEEEVKTEEKTDVKTEVKTEETDKEENSTDEEKKDTTETSKSEIVEKTETEEKADDGTKKLEETKVEKTDDIFKDGWFENGEFKEELVNNEVVREAIKTVIGKFLTDRNTERIDRAVDDILDSDYSINVSKETLKKMLDLSEVVIGEDGTITGIKEAIEALKTKEPGLFKSKDKESNPLNEGFNPVEKNNNSGGMPKNFAQAFRIMEEIS